MECTETSTSSWSILDSINNSQTRLFDLQLFNGEKTEEATPKRKEEARDKGQVAKSVEVNSTVIILMAFLTLKILGSYLYEELASFMRHMFANLATADFTIAYIQTLFIDSSIVLFKTILPIMIVILVTSIFINFLQVGVIFSFEPLKPNLDKINPIKGFQRLFSKRSLVELAKSLFKISIIGYFIYGYVVKQTLEVPKLIGLELIDSIKFTITFILDLVFQIGGVMIIIAALDYFYQSWEHRENLKMSKYEVKQEYKQTEGNPQIKGKIREKQRAMAMRRMMQEVPKADVVITNPTHFAVALKYEQGMMAPVVVAKGQDFIAERIKEIAKQARVTVVENKPLARALYSSTEIGDVVPPELYKAVAEVLAYVYRLKKKLS